MRDIDGRNRASQRRRSQLVAISESIDMPNDLLLIPLELADTVHTLRTIRWLGRPAQAIEVVDAKGIGRRLMRRPIVVRNEEERLVDIE